MKIRVAVLSLGLFVACLCPAQSKPTANNLEAPNSKADSKSAQPEAPAPVVAAVSKERIPSGARIYVAPMGGFETYVVAGLMKKQVPIIVVNNRDKADYEITGASESQKASWAKMLFMSSQQSHEEASVVVANIKTGVVVFGYNVNKGNSVRGKQSAAEACAKHIKNNIQGSEQ